MIVHALITPDAPRALCGMARDELEEWVGEDPAELKAVNCPGCLDFANSFADLLATLREHRHAAV